MEETGWITLSWNVDVVLTHTAPLRYEPIEVFLPGINQRMVDKSTEAWLSVIEGQLEYQKWYCGHYHRECWMASERFRAVYESIQLAE